MRAVLKNGKDAGSILVTAPRTSPAVPLGTRRAPKKDRGPQKSTSSCLARCGAVARADERELSMRYEAINLISVFTPYYPKQGGGSETGQVHGTDDNRLHIRRFPGSSRGSGPREHPAENPSDPSPFRRHANQAEEQQVPSMLEARGGARKPVRPRDLPLRQNF